MSKQGFVYLEPLPLEFIISQEELTMLLQDVGGLDPTSSRFRARYSYGLTTIDAYLSKITHPIDPNADILAEMDAAGQQAWFVALYGQDLAKFTDPSYIPAEPELSGDFGDTDFGGCAREAMEASGLIDVVRQDDASELQEMIARIESAEGFVELERDWTRCAADKGYGELTSFSSIQHLFWDKLSEIEVPDPYLGLGDDVTLTEQEYEKLQEQQELYRQRYAPEDLARVQQEELDLAQDLADCDIAYWTGFAEIEDRLFPDG